MRPASRSRRVAAGLAAAVAAVTVTACGSGHSQASTTEAIRARVVVANQMFSPMTITVPVHSEVAWSFQDNGLPHDVIFPSFKSGPMASGTFTHAFDKPGVYKYHCSIHPWMTGTVDVTTAGQA